MNRNALIAASVVLFHVAALWALQTGLLRRAVEIIVPAQIIAKQGVKGVDATSRATITGEAIINATAKALAQGAK